MKVKTYMSTDWIEVHDFDSSYFAKVFVTQNEAYMIVKAKDRTEFYKIKRELLTLGEIGFFQKVMEKAEKLPIEIAIEFGFLSKNYFAVSPF